MNFKKLRILTFVMGIALMQAEHASSATVSPHAETPAPISMSLALEAATETVKSCAEKGYKVVVTVVDPDGVIKVQLRGDGAPVHSLGFSFRKAFTVVSMGPMFGVDSSSGVINFITSKNPAGIGNIGAGATDLLFIPGAVLLTSGLETVGAIGVSGAPISIEDEVCARIGAAKIHDRLNKQDKNP
jgi:uncharacterized protein GlcG (DUF336 family)